MKKRVIDCLWFEFNLAGELEAATSATEAQRAEYHDVRVACANALRIFGETVQ